MDALFRFGDAAVPFEPLIDRWLADQADELRPIAAQWAQVIRCCGEQVRELIHDGHPTFCFDDAAFAYVSAYTAHVNVGFFRGAELNDPAGLLQGGGKYMRHVKLAGSNAVDEAALEALINAAYLDMEGRLRR